MTCHKFFVSKESPPSFLLLLSFSPLFSDLAKSYVFFDITSAITGHSCASNVVFSLKKL